MKNKNLQEKINSHKSIKKEVKNSPKLAKIAKIKPKSKQTVFVMLSGGVDSSVAACLLVQEGYQVVGVFIKCWSLEMLKLMNLTSDLYGCFWEDDARDARLVANKLGIPFEIWDFQQEYKTKVIDYMTREYARGRTPNPDVMCNGNIKFGIFLKTAIKRKADFVASGHYARIENY